MASLVFPFHDPQNIETKFLKQVLPLLKNNFSKAYVSITPQTISTNPDSISFFNNDEFFVININNENSSIGEHFLAGFQNAVKNSDPEEMLHLCSSDRVCFALLNYKSSFLKDIRNVNESTLFLRSSKAWSTHPKIYFAAESMLTEAGKILFDKTLDFAWCHVSMTADKLSELLPKLTARDLVITAQLVYLLRNDLQTKEVDWLSWEDPFILGKDPAEYRKEREFDPRELSKRMGYVKPQIDYLFEEYSKREH